MSISDELLSVNPLKVTTKFLFCVELVGINRLDVSQSIIVIIFMFQWPVGASSGWLVRPLDTAPGISEVTAESRKLRCSWQAVCSLPSALSWLKSLGPAAF